MSLDLKILQAMTGRKDYERIYPSIQPELLDGTTNTIIKGIKKYYAKFPEHESLDLNLFWGLFKKWFKNTDADRMVLYKNLIKQMKEPVDACTKSGIISDLAENALAARLMAMCSKHDEGVLETPLTELVTFEMDRYKTATAAKAIQWDNTDIDTLLDDDVNDEGIAWRLRCLNESMRKLRPGDFGIVAARPDTGKTSFLASEVSFMAKQLPPDKNIIWLNNESTSGKIVKRIYQAALGKTIPEMIEMRAEKGSIKKAYAKSVGRADKIRVYDIHGWSVGQVDALLEASNPGIIIYDMLDHVRGYTDADRADLNLESLYMWARERSVKYSCIGFATSQISADGEGKPYPTKDMLKDSKTGKQGACDFILMIGATNDKDMKSSRFISLTKNKLHRDGFKQDPMCEVEFDSRRSIYKDIE